MSADQPFMPRRGSGQIVVIGALGTGVLTVDAQACCKQVRIVNRGANLAYIALGNASVTASATSPNTDYEIEAGQVSLLTKNQDDTTLAYNSPAGTTLHVMVGEGK